MHAFERLTQMPALAERRSPKLILLIVCEKVLIQVRRLGWLLSRQPWFEGEEQALMDVWRAHVMAHAVGR